MKPAVKVLIGVALIAIIYAIIRAINSLPDYMIAQAKSMDSVIQQVNEQLEQTQKTWEKAKQAESWTNFKIYAEREQWDNSFLRAQQLLSQARKLYDEEVTTLLDKNHKSSAPKLNQLLNDIRQQLEKVRSELAYPLDRLKAINESILHKDDYLKDARQSLASQQAEIGQLTDLAQTHQQDYPNKAEQINTLLQPPMQQLKQSQQQVDTLSHLLTTTPVDFAKVTDTYAEVIKTKDSFAKAVQQSKDTITQLSRSYVRILADQKIDYYITIGRANWCESDGCGDGIIYRYPPTQVDQNTFEYFNDLDLNTIARMSRSWGEDKFSLNIPQNRWNALNIQPKQAWNSSYPYAEYWVDKFEVKPYHKYTTLENGDVEQSDWVAVSLADYEKNFEFLGMALVTKPLGVFESEAITTPEPVGMATIAEPKLVNGVATGKNQYGEWRQDSNGHSFWYYYGMYRLLSDFIPGGGYGYDTYRCYRGRPLGQPFYGCGRHYGTFGRYTYTNKHYKNTRFSKQNPSVITAAHTGKYSNVNHSVRGMGSTNRGRGPSRSGK
jgi:hypothetical protein